MPGRPTSFVPTSGSASAWKLIPYTAALRGEFQAAIAAWIVEMFRAHPALVAGQAYWSISPVTWEQRTTSGGIPIGFADDTEYLHPLIAGFLQQAMAVPPSIASIHDMSAFRYMTLAFLLRSRELRFISVWNPTFLTLLLEPLEQWAEALLRDLAEGTLTPPGEMADGVMAQLRAGSAPNRQRARELELALAQPENSERLARCWPRLALVSCWSSAAAARAGTRVGTPAAACRDCRERPAG